MSEDQRNVLAVERAAKKLSDYRQFRYGDGFATMDQVHRMPVMMHRKVFYGKKPAEPPKEIIRTEPRVERSFLVGIPPAEAWPADLSGRFIDGVFHRMEANA